MNEQKEELKEMPKGCGPGCNCGTAGGGSSRVKWVVCGVVLLAAVATAAVHVSRTRAVNDPVKTQGYSTTIPAVAPVEVVETAAVDCGWGVPLNALSELNIAATNTDAVFVVVPSSDTNRTVAIQKDVSAATATITARGVKTGMFLMGRDSQEYAGVVQQIGVPAVLVMCKGAGMVAVPDKQVNQDNLLKAFVGASRPSGCGPSGCGPGQSSCN